jgi:demethylmenaquinone methyltransferase/2-methoxy-6-polyprenyl-1,4-benzoquinol methylase
MMAELNPDRIVGLDISSGMLAVGKQKNYPSKTFQ